MADNTMMRICTLGLSMMFERQEPDLDKPIYRHTVELKRVGLTEGKVSKLAKCMAGEDGVLTSDDFINDCLASVEIQGTFQLHVQREYTEQFIAKYRGHELVHVVMCYDWGPVQRHRLAHKFPDEFEGRHFCPECDKEKKEATDPCENGECEMGLCNFREMQQKLKSTIDTMAADAKGISYADAVAEQEPMATKYVCPGCGEEFGMSSPLDKDGEFECDQCMTWIGQGDIDYE